MGMNTESKNGDQREYWLDRPANVNKIVYALCAVCGLLLLADFFYHKHVHFEIESWFGFYGWYGFVSCVGLVLAAKMMRKVVMRPEGYYREDWEEDRDG